ncbi:MAG: hypothetical protein ABL902_09145 [Gallionella sp.]
MNLNDLKTAFAKERHAELIIASGGAILIAALASILDPETLKMLDTPCPASANLVSGNLAKVLVWSATILAGAFLIYKGLKRIDAERAASSTQSNVPLLVTPPSDTANPLAIQITHGNTHISINIQSEKNNA